MTDSSKAWRFVVAAGALVATIFYLWSRGSRSQEHPPLKQSTVAPYLIQLMNPPPASASALDASGNGVGTSSDPRQIRAAQTARDWLSLMLKPSFRPPLATPFLAFPAEAGTVDVVRARYVANEAPVEVAQTLCVAVVGVTPTIEERRLTCIDRARRVADRLLETTAPLELVETDMTDRMSHGTRRGPRRTTNPFWEEDLEWWCTSERVTFVVIKGMGYPGRLVLSFDVALNTRWFALL